MMDLRLRRRKLKEQPTRIEDKKCQQVGIREGTSSTGDRKSINTNPSPVSSVPPTKLLPWVS